MAGRRTTGQAGRSDSNLPARSRRNWWYFAAGAVLVLCIGGIYAKSAVSALSIRSATGSEFSTYVVDHHIGSASIQTDSSGLQSDFCVLTLNAAIPDRQLQNEAFHLMNVYHSLDGGDTLTIQYVPQGGPAQIEASVFYDSATEIVTMDLQQASGHHVVKRKVNWAPNPYND